MHLKEKIDPQGVLKSIRLRLVLYFVLFLILPMSVFAVFEYRYEKSLIRNRVMSQLDEMADSRVSVLKNWIEDRKADVGVLSDNVLLREHFTALASKGHEDLEKLRDDQEFIILEEYLDRVVRSYGYLEATLCSTEGVVLVSSNPDRVGKDLSGARYFDRGLSATDGKVHVEDVFYMAGISSPVMAFSMPVSSYGRSGREGAVSGVAIMVFDLADTFYPALAWTGMGASGETLLVRREGDDIVVLNPLRHFADAPLVHHIPASLGSVPSVLSASGDEGIVEADDYRGVKVLAAYRFIPEVGWGYVAKVDASEAFSPVRELWKTAILTLALSALFVVMLLVVLTGKIVAPISVLAENTRKLSRGDFSVNLPEAGNDEIGELTRSFNIMAQELNRSHGELGKKSLELERANRELLSLTESLEEKVAERTAELEELNRAQADLLKDLDERTAALEASQSDLKKFAGELEESRNRVRENLEIVERANVELRRMDRMKDHFLGMISHELRTPLSLIMGYSSNMLANPTLKLNPSVEEELEGIYKGADRLRSIITEMLDISRIDSKGLELNLRSTDIGNLVGDVVRELGLFIKERGQTVEVGDFSGMPELMLDRGKMYQVLINIVGNAIKFTPDGGRIEISPHVQSVSSGFAEENELDYTEQLDIVVRDKGIGIDREDLVRIFEKFYEVGDIEKHTTSKYQFLGRGVGLGLPIARGIVEAHGGMLWAESEGYDPAKCPGSNFHILLPIRTSSAVEGAQKAAAGSSEAVEYAAEGARSIEKTGGADAGERPKVLVVENDVDVLNLTMYVLRKKFDVYKALDGREGIETARRVKPDLILLDVYMEGMDGFDVCEVLKKDSETAGIKIALFTAGVQKWEIEKGFSSGADDYITKPFKPDELLAKVDGLISGSLERAHN